MFLIVLFMAHFIADFTFQPAVLAQKKIDKSKYLAIHIIIYAVVFLIAIFPFVSFSRAVFPYLIIVGSHFLTDWIRKRADKRFNNKTFIFASFIADQICHALVLTIIYYAFNLGAETKLYGLIQQWPNLNNLIIYSLTFVILWDPAAVFIKKLFTYISDGNSCEQEENDPPAGRIIGKLERIIISFLIFNNQFGTIGFVLTAKSIARYKQLEDKIFAERYLVGTLASALISIITTIILKQYLQ
jgi:hypothetical protein